MLIITKRADRFETESNFLEEEAQKFLGWQSGFSLSIYHLYELKGISEEEGQMIADEIFSSEKDEVSFELPEVKGKEYFRFHQIPGQYNEREEMTKQMIQNVLGFEKAELSHSKLFVFDGIKKEQLTEFKEYYLNPVENEEIDLHAVQPQVKASATDELNPIEGFIELSDDKLREFGAKFSMDHGDMKMAQDYFKSENRNPNLTELNVIDTYWSDHCRHTTFNTQIDDIRIDAGAYEDLFQAALNDYMQKRDNLERTDRPVSLMDMGTIQAKELRRLGILDNVEISAEINACALEIKVDVDGEEEDWILYFKNETHNHPTEIEPFGGASTCVGGGVRDPLSGRSWVYQAMRITGAKDSTLSYEETREDKLPQRIISQRALEGNSDYANQIGVTGAYAREIFHDGFEAKRLEVGALISAAPQRNIVREEPEAGDIIIMLGGLTGRDGLGAAVGSSQIQTEESLENVGAEVQKGAPAVERKITRLFRNGDATRLIKRCNDFGAGGVAVAVGELTDGLLIDLDKVPVKYEGMHGGEIALAESQERMAVVIAKENVEAFLAYAHAEDVESAIIAEVTDDARMRMIWQGEEIINISREFLDTEGADKHTEAQLLQPESGVLQEKSDDTKWTTSAVLEYMGTLNRSSQKSMGEQYDASIGRATVLYPYGGERRATPELGMVSRLPVLEGKTTTVSGMAYGYDPYLAEESPFHGGYYAVIDSVARMVAMGFDYKEIRLTFQEFFESLGNDAYRWGKPVLALLGANKAMDNLDLGSIGGKDSMSGTFEELEVPPTLISFAIAPGVLSNITSRALLNEGSQVVLIENTIEEDGTLIEENSKEIFESIHNLIQKGVVGAVSSIGIDGMLYTMIEMAYGNYIGVNVTDEAASRLQAPMMGSFLVEIAADADVTEMFAGLNATVVGVTQANVFEIQGNTIEIADIEDTAVNTLDNVYPETERFEQDIPAVVKSEFVGQYPGELKNGKANVLIPVTYGSNSEYDLRDAFLSANFEVTEMVIKNSSKEELETSVQEFISNLDKAQVLALPSGAVFGNEPQEQGRFWKLFLGREDVATAVNKHLEGQGLVYGTGAAFVALIENGLIEFGKVQKGTSIEVLPNEKGKFISDIVNSTIISENNAWSKGHAGEVYSTTVATSWGRIALNNEALDSQVVSVFNEYYAEENIDAMTSPNGLVFGSLSQIERMDESLYINVVETDLPPFIQQAQVYFN